MHFTTLGRILARSLAAAFLMCPMLSQADTKVFSSVADATLFQASPNNNLGDGGSIMSGGRPKDLGLNRTRGLLRFDLGSLPANAVITNVSLTLKVVTTPSPQVNSVFDLRRVLVSWGNEGAGSDRGGGAAAANQVTWNSRFFGGLPWSTPGGAVGVDFGTGVSAFQSVAGNGSYNFSGANLLSDVQSWYANSANNFGWVLMSESETSSRTVRRFGSHESGSAGAPVLNVQFTTVPEPGAIGLMALGGMTLALACCRRKRR